MEVSVAQVLLQRDEDFSTLLELLKGEQVKTAAALKKINWPDSQSDIYARLSRMTHPSRIHAFLGRTLDFDTEPLKSLVAQQDIAGIANEILWGAALEGQEAHQERWAFIALNTFDLAISSLFTLYRERAPECEWWPCQGIPLLESVAETYPMIKQDLLWFRLVWPHSKRSELEISFDDIFNSDSDGAARA
jgi:hypothetical protein